MWVPCGCGADRLSPCVSLSLPLNTARSRRSAVSPLHQQDSSTHCAEAELMLTSCFPTTPQEIKASSKPLNFRSLCGLALPPQRRSSIARLVKSPSSMLRGSRKAIHISNQMETVGLITPTVSCALAPPLRPLCVTRHLTLCTSTTGTPPLRSLISTPPRHQCSHCTTSHTKVPLDANGLTSLDRKVITTNGGMRSTRSQEQSPSPTTSSPCRRITQQKLLKTATASVLMSHFRPKGRLSQASSMASTPQCGIPNMTAVYRQHFQSQITMEKS